MWRIANFELRPATLDFTASEQGWRKVTQLFADGVQIINAVELVDWDAERVQFLICEQCGFEHCEPGGWVSVRRRDSSVFILPSTDYVLAEQDADRNEYSPPQYLKERGVAYFDRTTYETLRTQHPSFPAFETIRELNNREAELLND